MKNAEFVEKLAAAAKLDKKQAKEVVDQFWALTLKTIKSGDEIVFQYGKFILKKKPAREGRNPLTGETVKIAAKVVPQFKPNKKFKDEVVA